jgi:mRNA interferase RelE/StbE
MPFDIVLTQVAVAMLSAIKDRRILQGLGKVIDGLTNDPEQQGKPLTADLAGYRTIRAVGQRYRIIFRVDQGRVVVLIVAVGLRKAGDKQDVYALAKKLIRLGLVDPAMD